MIRTATLLCLPISLVLGTTQPMEKKQLVAHRGASAYAPEHTLVDAVFTTTRISFPER